MQVAGPVFLDHERQPAGLSGYIATIPRLGGNGEITFFTIALERVGVCHDQADLRADVALRADFAAGVALGSTAVLDAVLEADFAVDLESDFERSRLPTNGRKFLIQWLAFEGDQLDLMTCLLLGFGERHHAVDRAINEVRRTSDVGNP